MYCVSAVCHGQHKPLIGHYDIEIVILASRNYTDRQLDAGTTDSLSLAESFHISLGLDRVTDRNC